MNERKAIALLLWTVLGMIFLIYVLALSCSDAKAGQWVSVNQFKGLATHTNGLNNDPSVARYVNGWFVRTDGLEKPWFQKIRSSSFTTSPTYILGQNSSADAILFFNDALYSSIRDTVSPVGFAQTALTDSAFNVSTTDSILYSTEDSLSEIRARGIDNWWLMWTLTDRPSIFWDSVNVGVLGWYSNRWILVNKTNINQTGDLPIGRPIATPSVSEGSGTLELPIDSTLLFDGSYIWIYSGDNDSILNSSSTTVQMPTYTDTGRVFNTYESGDSLIFVINDVASPTKYWLLWDDSLLTSHATPDSIISAITYGTDSMRCIVLADTIKYKSANHYHGRQNGSGNMHMFYVLYQPGAVTQFRRLGDVGTNKSLDTLVTTGGQSVGPAKYARWHTHVNQTGANGIWNLLNVGFTSRTTDRNIWQVTTDAASHGDDVDTAFAILLKYSVSDIGANWRYLDFLLFDTDSLKASEWSGGSGTHPVNSLFNRPVKTAYNATTNPTGWAITTVSTTTSNDRFATLHRQRAFASGNTHINSTTGVRDSTTWLRYTRIAAWPAGDTANHTATDSISYKVFPKYNKFQLEGYDPVTGLSSLGQTLGVYRRHSISLLTGFAASDFYLQPAPVGQGSANHWVISRSAQDNADAICNENGMFLFSGSGLEPLSENVVELFSDSINWNAENKLRGAVFDNMYFVTCPIDTHTTNNRIIAVDLDTRNSWMSDKPRASSIWNFKDDDGSEELYFGDADSSVLWKMNGSSSNYYYVPEWKSSWFDLGDANQEKIITRHRIEFDPGTYHDTLYVDWYINLTDTLLVNDTVKTSPLWTDTIPCNTNERAFTDRYPNGCCSIDPGYYNGVITSYSNSLNFARSQDAKRQTIERPVSRIVHGKFLSFGIRGRSVASTEMLRVMRYAFEFESVGGRRR